MAKTIQLDPIGTQTSVQTNDNILSALLGTDLQVSHECGGRGRCATCHVFIKEGMENLSPMSRREQQTLEVITTCNMQSRLACQTRVLDEGVVVQLPAGTYLNEVDDLDALIGRRAQEKILHPLNGTVLVEQNKLITRSVVNELAATRSEVGKYLANSGSATE
ncbi:2Fe-2S iron-sulfur cluster binding domain-containing protein [filamentous cyanobacterium LEGE 11480]|uniref:2Fe-2S iron-sulfur cluster binding domain-containing protein n=1 Tax=Romeriopsis navalis LEGE 11480 TaxID=2777977 RepID=A0A928VQ12_9CYAN|nr:2Fe-2S iron-sulfur cluster-binding protein [Romeriopsis navalis]MBE9029994.1 2Fe-2S iron-sulfur cluster binding domain-containing protein [Romeriopsis navalis LEGE 11480]